MDVLTGHQQDTTWRFVANSEKHPYEPQVKPRFNGGLVDSPNQTWMQQKCSHPWKPGSKGNQKDPHTVGGQNSAPKKPWNDDSLANTHGFQVVQDVVNPPIF